MTSPEEEQAKRRISKEPPSDDMVIIWAGPTFEEHILGILKEKRDRLDIADGLPRFARGGLCPPLEAGREPREERHTDTP